MDRNNGRFRAIHNAEMSLSARRAWIEMTQFVPITTSDVVALRKESVDRNLIAAIMRNTDGRSLSARRAWIEI